MGKLDLSDMARNIVDELRNDEPKRKVKVTIVPNMTANGDKNLLRLVLQNLLGNAWKYTSKTAEQQIEMGTIECNGKQACFVRDNGVGFDMTYAPNYWPVPKLTSPQDGGLKSSCHRV
jgi:light-regulated signal transduction histidine kinase (bacteriophytochrome)